MMSSVPTGIWRASTTPNCLRAIPWLMWPNRRWRSSIRPTTPSWASGWETAPALPAPGARQQSGAGGSNPLYVQVRYALSQGDWQRAQQLLEQVEVQDAQWHFLTGRVCQMRGWYDQALQQFELACQLDPANAEYRDARERMQYNGRGFSSSPVDAAPCETCAQCAICSLFAQCCCNGCC